MEEPPLPPVFHFIALKQTPLRNIPQVRKSHLRWVTFKTPFHLRVLSSLRSFLPSEVFFVLYSVLVSLTSRVSSWCCLCSCSRFIKACDAVVVVKAISHSVFSSFFLSFYFFSFGFPFSFLSFLLLCFLISFVSSYLLIPFLFF